MLETVILTSICAWFAFFLLNYAEIFDGLREWVFPRLHPTALYIVGCPVCITFWALAAYSLFTGFTPLILYVPVCTLFIDLAFNKLRDGCK